MRKIDESKITSDKSMFFKQGTWTHLQKAYKEITEETIKSLIGSSYDATKVYVLNGCVNSGSGSSFNISAGSVFYAGEVYLVDATTFTTSGGNVAVGTITTTNNTTDYSADPCLFTDGTYENVHNIRKFVIAGGATGSGTKNYSAFDFYPFAFNFKDISSNITAGTNITISAIIARQYFDGSIAIWAIITTTSNIAADSDLISGIPNAAPNSFSCHAWDGSTKFNINLYAVLSHIQNPFGVINSGTQIAFYLTYRQV